MILQGKYHPIDFKLLKKRLCAYTGAERGIHSPILLARTFYARCYHCDVNCQTPCLADLSWNIKYFHNIKLAAEILQGATIFNIHHRRFRVQCKVKSRSCFAISLPLIVAVQMADVEFTTLCINVRQQMVSSNATGLEESALRSVLLLTTIFCPNQLL